MTKLLSDPALLAALVAAAVGALGLALAPGAHAQAGAAAPAGTPNPLLEPWTGPYDGLPPFDRVEVAHFEPALEAAMAEHLAEIEAIATSKAMPTFENTIAALERAGATMQRVSAVYGVWAGNMSTPEFQAVQRTMSPRLAAYSDRITQNEALFERIEAVYTGPEMAALTPEQQRLVWLYHNNFVRAGARLDAAQKARLSAINQELAGLFTQFGQNVLADETDLYLVIRDETDLAGLPQSAVDAAAAAAESRGYAGAWVIANTRSAMEPFLTYAHNRDLRRQAFELFTGRGDNGDANDNNALISQILALRAERAALLGYETHAHWRTENTMAGDPYAGLRLMEQVWTPAVARVREEVADMQAIADARGDGITIEPWDYRYYAEIVRKERYDLDENEVKPYLQLDRLVDGMFWVGGELFGFDFAEVRDVPVFHEDVRVWNVTSRETGAHVGLFYFDPYARAGKRSGAWMTSYRPQQRMDGKAQTVLVSNNSNFIQGRPGEPVLISWGDAETLFHEFGHALHGLASDVTYPSLSGTAVARDYVEFPSQLLEHWLATPEVLDRFAVHYQTGEPMPRALVERIERAAGHGEGFRTVEFLASGLYDMRVHLEREHPIDARAFEERVLAEYGLPREIVMRHRPTHFLHIFSSDGYSAGYYSYLWSDVLTADAYEAFLEGEGPYDRAVADRLVRHVFSAGNTVDPAEGYRAFRGRDPEVDALMRKRGFADEAPSVGVQR
ncbi:MAG: M3 family metallopeptidase [Rubricoccaceae bacterium]